MTGRTSVEKEEVFLFDRSLIVCHNKGKTGLFGMEDEYSFWIRFPMNTLKVGVNFNFFMESCGRWRTVIQRVRTLLSLILQQVRRKMPAQR